jgi:hypothetical protein
MSQGRVMSQDRSVVSEALDIAQLKLMSGVVRSFFSNLRRFTQIQLYVAGRLLLVLPTIFSSRCGASSRCDAALAIYTRNVRLFDMIRTY